MRAGINQLAFAADWVFPGLEEGRLLTGLQSPEEIARYYREHGARLVVIKLGADGAYFDNGAEQAYVPGCPVDTVVDPVGAGDGFAVGVFSALLEGLPLRTGVDTCSWIVARAGKVRAATK